MGFVDRGVKAVAAQVRPRIQSSHWLNELRGEPRGRVHRNVERDQAGLADRLLTERLAGEVEARDRCAAGPKPRRWRRQTERLVAKLIR